MKMSTNSIRYSGVCLFFFQSYRDNPKVNAIVLAKGRLKGKEAFFYCLNACSGEGSLIS